MHLEITLMATQPDGPPVLAYTKSLIIQPEGDEDRPYLLDVTSAMLEAIDEGRAAISQQAERLGVKLPS